MAKRNIRMTPAFFHILLSLVRGRRHGYTILGEIAERTHGRIKLGPSSLYWSLGRLEQAALIEETSAPADAQDQRRRYYRLTHSGRAVLRSEIEVLADILSHAEAQQITGEAS